MNIKDKIYNLLIESEDIDKILKASFQSGNTFAQALIQLDSEGILEKLLPEITQLKRYEHPYKVHPEGAVAINKKTNDREPYDINNAEHNSDKYTVINGTVWDHTIEALKSNKLEDSITNLSILLHDIGKQNSQTFKNDRVRYFNHAYSGLDIIKRICNKLKLSDSQKDGILFAVMNHMKIHDFLKMRESKVQQLVKDKNWDLLYRVGMADAQSRGSLFDDKEWQKVIDRIKSIKS